MNPLKLNFCPDFDSATKYSFKWNQRLIAALNCSNITELLEKDATRANFEKYALDADLFIFYDHGGKAGLVAQGGLSFAVDSRNVDLLRGAEVYTMCCLTAKGLGAEAYRKGIKVWWGYTENFSFIPSSEEIYSELANMGLLLVKNNGMDWTDAFYDVQAAFDAAIAKNDAENGDPWVSVTLVADRDALVCWTDETPPPTDCTFRQLGINVFGRAGNKISRLTAVSFIAFLIFWGYGLHDAGHHVYQLKGTPLSLEGVYVGFAGMLGAFLVYAREQFKWLSKN